MKNNLEKIVLVAASLLSLVVVLIKLPVFEWQSWISLASSIIFGVLFYQKIKPTNK